MPQWHWGSTAAACNKCSLDTDGILLGLDGLDGLDGWIMLDTCLVFLVLLFLVVLGTSSYDIWQELIIIFDKN